MQLFGSKMPTNDKCAFSPLLLHTYIHTKQSYVPQEKEYTTNIVSPP